jgi:arylsulfatase A-like enzyme
MVSLYDDEISFVDRAVGKILDEMKKLGLDRKTLVIVMADHGESLGEHGYYFDHGDLLYENQLRVPLIIRYPGMPGRGKTIEPQVRTVDLMPTILQIMDIKYSGMIDGASLLPLIHGRKASPGTGYAFSETDTISFSNMNCRGYIEGVAGKHISVRTDGFKLIYIPKRQEPVFELYDLRRDPLESRNIIGENTAAGDELKRVLFRWLSRPRRPPTPREKLGEETQKILKSLGYVR